MAKGQDKNGNFEAFYSSSLEFKGILSRLVWEIDWAEYFPWKLSDTDCVVRQSSYEEYQAFANKNFGVIYEGPVSPGNFLFGKDSEPRNRFYRIASDFFAFMEKNQCIGVFAGNPLDWCTYYIRQFAILPDFQTGGISQKFLRYFIDVLGEHGVPRVEADVSPANPMSIHTLNKLNFVITGTMTSEVWGALIRFTKFTEAQSASVFQRQFCAHGTVFPLKDV